MPLILFLLTIICCSSLNSMTDEIKPTSTEEATKPKTSQTLEPVEPTQTISSFLDEEPRSVEDMAVERTLDTLAQSAQNHSMSLEARMEQLIKLVDDKDQLSKELNLLTPLQIAHVAHESSKHFDSTHKTITVIAFIELAIKHPLYADCEKEIFDIFCQEGQRLLIKCILQKNSKYLQPQNIRYDNLSLTQAKQLLEIHNKMKAGLWMDQSNIKGFGSSNLSVLNGLKRYKQDRACVIL